MNVLIVEDDDGLAEALGETLGAHGFPALRAATGAEALERLSEAGVVLLDLGLPDLDGHEVCRRIREVSCVPVIAMSGRTEELDRVMALHLGADDFVPKPFSRRELVARIRSLLRRAGGCAVHGGPPPRAGRRATDEPLRGPVPDTAGEGWAPTPVRAAVPEAAPPPDAVAPSPVPAGVRSQTVGFRPEDPPARPVRPLLQAGPVRLDPRTRKVFAHGAEIRVTRKEFDLLAMLIEEPGTVVERGQIMSRVWDENWYGSTRTLDVHVGSLRSKLGDARWIETVRGVGYRLAVPLSAVHA
ncbi:response regulator transcription factor [Streptomyces sp. SID8352]|uniref:response regulator transcription factor n=1 Tax=Streptomyces sp. SID8352 TaxID=2690338 RepID=UPI00136FC931|nr:response regulator transcription factor [Streptomyces sp. SID8352]MYU24691.1 response regulator [Streptomyces sp. SID8352]